MHVDRVKPGERERRRHLDVPVHALLAQHGDARLSGPFGRGDLLVRIVRQVEGQARVRLVQTVVVLLPRRDRIVPQSLHAVGRLAPGAPQPGDVRLDRLPRTDENVERPQRARHGAHDRSGHARLAEDAENGAHVLFAHLQNRARLFVEKLFQDVAIRQFRHKTPSARDRHFGERDRETAVAAVVVGEREPALHDLLHRVEEVLQKRGVRVRGGIAQLPVDLRERRRPERIFPVGKVHIYKEGRFAFRIRLQIGREREPHVVHRRKRRHDKRQRRHLLLLFARRVRPGRVHRARILADRDRHAEFRAELQADRLHGIVEDRVLPGVAARRHPVRRQANLPDGPDVRRGQVRQRFRDREPPRRRTVQKRDRRAFARGHRLPLVCLVPHRRHRAIRRGKLILAHHLVARHAARDRTVRDGDEERLVRHRRQVQDAPERLHRLHVREVRRLPARLDMLDVPHHPRRFAEQHLDVHVDRVVVEVGILEHQASVARRHADERDRTPLARAQFLEKGPGGRLQREHVPLLRLAAPDLHRAHGLLFVVHRAQFELAARLFHELGAPVRESARADVVDRENRVGPSERRARVDDALAPPLHFGVAALDGIEVERFRIRAGHHGGRRAASQADAHRRPADLHDQRPDLHVLLQDLRAADDPHAAGEHDRFVVAAQFARDLALVRAEEPAQLRTPEFVAERRAAQGTFRHDLQRRGQPLREVRVHPLPRLRIPRYAQVGDHESADARHRARTRARRRLVADLAADARRRARIRRNRRRVVVRLDLHELVDLVLAERVGVRLGIRRENVRREALHHRRIVRVGRERIQRTLLVRVLDHLEERMLLLLAVDDEFRAENLVAAVLRVDLPEHDKLRIRRIAPRRGEALGEIRHLRLGNRQPQLLVGRADRLHALRQHVVRAPGLRFAFREKVREVRVDALGHLVVKRRGARREAQILRFVPGLRGEILHVEPDAALHAQDALQAAVPEDVRRLRAPGRNRALARRHVEVGSRTVPFGVQQNRRALEFFGVERLRRQLQGVHPPGVYRDRTQLRIQLRDGVLQCVHPERRISL